jgi:hypothetical protein
MEPDMKFRWIASLCLAALTPIAQADSDRAFELKASAAFAKANPDQYLMVYTSPETDSGPNVFARVLGLDGAPMGKDFRLSTQTGQMSKSVVAYSPANERFLVVWGRKLYDEKRSELIAQTVGLNGKVLGEAFRLSVSDLYDQRPAIAYCPGSNRFLVTWTRGTAYDFDKGVSDIYGQFVDGDGARVMGGNFTIASATKNQFKSDVSCDVRNDRFMVVWEDQRNDVTHDDVYGQLIASDGTLLGDNFVVAETSNVERRPVVWANKDGDYLVAWESVQQDGTVRIFSRMVDSNGILLGKGPQELGGDVGGSRNRPEVSYLKTRDMYLVVWDNSGGVGASDGIYGQFIEGGGKLHQGAIPLTTAKLDQYRPDVSAGTNTWLALWTDFRDTADPNAKHHVYEYYGRVIGPDVAMSSRWRNPQSR